MTFEHVYLRGMHFRGSHAKEYVHQLQIKQELFLVREPNNPHDTNAIQVWTADPVKDVEKIDDGTEVPNGFHFAYVSADQAMWIAPEMDRGVQFTCTVDHVDHSGRTPYPVVAISANA